MDTSRGVLRVIEWGHGDDPFSDDVLVEFTPEDGGPAIRMILSEFDNMY